MSLKTTRTEPTIKHAEVLITQAEAWAEAGALTLGVAKRPLAKLSSRPLAMEAGKLCLLETAVIGMLLHAPTQFLSVMGL